MAVEMYTIKYKSLDDVAFRNNASVREYLKDEAIVWDGFLESIFTDEAAKDRGVTSVTNRFEDYLDKDRKSKMTDFPANRASRQLPPPSVSLPGQLTLGLFERGKFQEARSVFTTFLFAEGFLSDGTVDGGAMISWFREGQQLLAGARGAEVLLPYLDVSSKRLSEAERTAKIHVNAMLDLLKEMQLQRIRAVESLSMVEKKAAQQREAHEAEQEALKEKFQVQMQYRAPVKLWADRQRGHKISANSAFRSFLGFAGIAILIALAVPFFAGDYIAASFYQIQGTEQVFSVKGPLTIAGLLLVMSLMLWGIRLQYRVYLSERHLALDAGEKKAFAQTFLALREDKSVGADNEAIVLASLFRPTQDGIIRDDEASLDISAAALLAKQLGSRN